MNLSTPLTAIPRAKRFLPKLKKLDIGTVRDLLYHFPSRYDDFSHITPIAHSAAGVACTVRGTIANIAVRRLWRRNMSIVNAVVSDETGSVRIVWFNQPYLANTLKPGTHVNIAGVPSARTGELLFSNPAHETITHGTPSHTARIIPVYPQTRGLTSRGLRYLIKPLLEESYEDPLPETVREAAHLSDVNRALHDAHFPENDKDARSAMYRFVFEELFTFQLYQTLRRRRFAAHPAFPIPSDPVYTEQLIAALPFKLTESQEGVLGEIREDIAKPYPMRRLLQGDVGSGKTVIASLAALSAARAGYQSALLAPTEILVNQHFETFMKLFPDYGEGVALLTGSRAVLCYGDGLVKATKRGEVTKKIAEGNVRIVIGTHALIQKHVTFRALALAVIDEQHRFGVEQRASLLRSAAEQGAMPHLLSMTATPIPRSLALTMWSDMDVSYLAELPQGRKRILTYVVPPEKRTGAYEFLRKQIREGRQVFVICPRIEKLDGEETELKTVTEEYEKLSKHVFPDLRVGLLHGRQKSEEKGSTMQAFSKGDLDLLVATSVIEVGVDIPNASTMLIEGAERFGLAQLYQLRGRVGRGTHQSYCLLFTDSSAPEVKERLERVAKAKNGLELAEYDLRLRGPGELFGTTQTGMPDLAMKAIQNPAIAKQARSFAAAVLDADPTLESHAALKRNIKLLIESLRGTSA